MLSKEKINPCVLRVAEFKSTISAPNSERIKNQYCYRVMLFIRGSATVISKDFKEVCNCGDTLYLLPDFEYRILNTHGDFEVLNIFFDYFPNTSFDCKNILKTTFQSEFDRSLCTPVKVFNSGYELNKSHIIFQNKNIIEYGLKIQSEARNSEKSSAKIVSLLMNCIIEEIAREKYKAAFQKSKEILAYISNHCAEKITAGELEKEFHYHRNHINRLIKSSTGMNLKSYILQAKLEYARKLFEETDMNLMEIANYLGFFDASHFIKTCKKFGFSYIFKTKSRDS